MSRRGDPDGGWGAEGAVRGDPGYRRARRWRRGSAAAGSLGDLGQVTSRAPGSLRCLPGEDGCRGRQRAFPRRDTPPHPHPPAPVPECGARQVRGNRPAGTGCWQAAGEKKMPLAQRALLRGRCRCKMPRDGRDRGRCPPKGSNTYLTVGHI